MIKVDIVCGHDGFKLTANFIIEEASVTIISGASGAGKTTLLSAIAGLNKNISGTIIVNGQDWSQLPIHKRKLGYVFQDALLFPHLTVQQNINYGRRRSTSNKRHYSINDVIGWLELEELLTKLPCLLSGGQARRVAIARSLLTYPDILLFDEALNGLDNENAMIIMQHISKIVVLCNIPALYATHNYHETLRLGDDLIYINNGIIKFNNTIEKALICDDLPFVHRPDGQNIVNGKIIHHDDLEQLTKVSTALGDIVTTRLDKTGSDNVRLLIAMNSISLAYEKEHIGTISNNLYLKVVAINPNLHGSVNITLGLNDKYIIARISNHSLKKMAIKIDDMIYAQIKAVSINCI